MPKEDGEEVEVEATGGEGDILAIGVDAAGKKEKKDIELTKG